ncbi:hypothetical protein D3C71_1911720 [compost metagenome]
MERSRIDLEQDLFRFDESAFGNTHPVDGAADTRTQFNGFCRLEVARELYGWRDLSRDDLGDRNLGHGRTRGSGRRDCLRRTGRGGKPKKPTGEGSHSIAVGKRKPSNGCDTG